MLPTADQTYVRKLDPSSRIDFYPTLKQGDDILSMLQPTETVIAFTALPSQAAEAAGLRVIDTPDDKAPRYANLVFGVWADLDPVARGNPIFDKPGLYLGVEITFETSLGRIDQFTTGILVVNK